MLFQSFSPFFHHKELDPEEANADVILFFLCILFCYLSEICPRKSIFLTQSWAPFLMYLFPKLETGRAGIQSAPEDEILKFVDSILITNTYTALTDLLHARHYESISLI